MKRLEALGNPYQASGPFVNIGTREVHPRGREVVSALTSGRASGEKALWVVVSERLVDRTKGLDEKVDGAELQV